MHLSHASKKLNIQQSCKRVESQTQVAQVWRQSVSYNTTGIWQTARSYSVVLKHGRALASMQSELEITEHLTAIASLWENFCRWAWRRMYVTSCRHIIVWDTEKVNKRVHFNFCLWINYVVETNRQIERFIYESYVWLQRKSYDSRLAEFNIIQNVKHSSHLA